MLIKEAHGGVAPPSHYGLASAG